MGAHINIRVRARIAVWVSNRDATFVPFWVQMLQIHVTFAPSKGANVTKVTFASLVW